MAETFPFTELPRELAEFSGQKPPKYRQLYNSALDGDLPVERRNGRLHVRKTDVPAIAQLLGLTAEAVTAD